MVSVHLVHGVFSQRVFMKLDIFYAPALFFKINDICLEDYSVGCHLLPLEDITPNMHTACGLFSDCLHGVPCPVWIKDLKVEFGAVIDMRMKPASSVGNRAASFTSMSFSILRALTQLVYPPEAIALCSLHFRTLQSNFGGLLCSNIYRLPCGRCSRDVSTFCPFLLKAQDR